LLASADWGKLMRLWREWRIVIVVGIICLGVGVVLGRLTVSVSRPRDVSVVTEIYTTCMYVYRDVAGCAEVMKKLAGNRVETN
jgi:hypothetical protein